MSTAQQQHQPHAIREATVDVPLSLMNTQVNGIECGLVARCRVLEDGERIVCRKVIDVGEQHVLVRTGRPTWAGFVIANGDVWARVVNLLLDGHESVRAEVRRQIQAIEDSLVEEQAAESEEHGQTGVND